MHYFSDDRGQDKRAFDWFPIPKNTTNHNMPTYLDAVYNGDVGKASLPPEWKKTANRKNVIVGTVACPVDVEVYENGALVARTNHNTVDASVTTMRFFVVNEEKYFNMQNDRSYRIVLRPFAKGEMTYAVYEGDLTRTQNAAVYASIPVEEDKTMVSEIGKAEQITNIKLYTTNEAGEKTAEILPDGSERPVGSLRVTAPDTATYKKAFTVSAEVKNLPSGARITWTASDAKVQLSPSADGRSCTVVSKLKGTVTLTAAVYDADRAIIAEANAAVTVQYAWWQVLIRIFLLGFLWY